MITLIAACSKNRVIGKDNKLIWNLPEDLKRFKDLTLGNPIVMGRKTYESIGKSLPGRLNIILTKNRDFKADNCLIYNNIYDMLEIYQQSNLFVIGGGEIYTMFLPHAKKIELTLIDKDFEGDTFFPELGSDWIESNVEINSNGEFEYKYITYQNL
jgi:dihydrofolate reductase